MRAKGDDIGRERDPAGALFLVGYLGGRAAGVVGFGEAVDGRDLRLYRVLDALLLTAQHG